MFTGIVEEVGTVVEVAHTVERSVLVINSPICCSDVGLGDSIAVNGVCLTIRDMQDECFVFDAMPETVRLTTLGNLSVGDCINLERAMTFLSRIGGHMVQGHSDGMTTIESIVEDGCALKIWFKKLPQYAECFIPKGYISIDGMSLTIVDVSADLFSICFIPHTQAITIVKNYCVGVRVNVEVDHIAKTVAMMLKNMEYGNGKHN